MTRPRGSIIEIGRRKYKVRWREPDGTGILRHRSQTIEAEGKKAAQGYLEERMKAASVAEAKLRFADLTLEDYVRDHYWPFLKGLNPKNPNPKPSTLIGYKCALDRHVLPPLGKMRMADIQPMHITQVLHQVTEVRKLSFKTARNLFFLLQSLFAHALDSDVIQRSPVRPKIHKRPFIRCQKPVWTPEQVKAILEAMPQQHKALFVCLALTSVRAGELLGLQWKHVKLADGKLHIEQSLWHKQVLTPKTQSSADTVCFGDGLKQVLLQHQRLSHHTRPDDFVFCKADGSPLNPDVLRRDVLYPVLDRLHIPRPKGKSGFHAFRHTGATIVEKNTGDPEPSQRMLRHSKAATTEGYIHNNGRDRYEDKKRLAALTLERAVLGDFVPQLVPLGHENKDTRVN